MIFVTVGTHEQQFNRLIKEIDRLKKENLLTEDVFIQSGYSDYEPKYCVFEKFLSYQDMQQKLSEASLVISHGGPATFMDALAKGKRVLVVPRQKQYNEHVNDHQLDFVKKVQKGYNIDVIEEIEELWNVIHLNEFKNEKFISNNDAFCRKFQKVLFDISSMK